MIYLDITDFDKQIKADVLTVVIGNDNAILDSSELATIAEMTSYLANRYDTANIFNKAGAARNSLIVLYAVDILLYHIHSRINPNKIPDLRGIRYESAITWLKMVSKGELMPDLPLLESPDGVVIGSVLYGSNEKRNLHF